MNKQFEKNLLEEGVSFATIDILRNNDICTPDVLQACSEGDIQSLGISMGIVKS